MTATRRGSRRSGSGGEADGDTDDPGAGMFGGGGGASVRGAALIAVAVLVGVVLLGKGFDTGFLPSTDRGDEQATGDTGNDDENADDDAADGTDEGGEGTVTSTSLTPTTHAAASVRVSILNGGGPQGAAGTSTTALGADGYVTLEPGNADPDVPASTVYFAPTFDADAAAVATRLGITNVPVALPATPPTGHEAPAAGTYDVLVVLGPEFTPVT